MAGWSPGRNPFPDGETERVVDFEYLDELKLVRHATVHVRKPPRSLWQLSANFRARMTVRSKDGTSHPVQVRAPRGMFTDLASVPEALWGFVGPIGRHLEAAILHDYLYMAWTDFRTSPSRRDWNFADEVFRAGMKVSKVRKRGLIFRVVHSRIGWNVFRRKPYTLKQRMDDWLPLLRAGHGRAG